VKLGPLRAGDVEAAVSLSTAEGWNQTAADWRRLLRLEPAGCFGGYDRSRLIGTVTTVAYGRAIAWIGMMVIEPEYRRRGLGAALMNSALDYVHRLGIPSVKLDATPAGQPLYESLGFVAETTIERWQGIADAGASATPPPVNASSRNAILDLDRFAFGADRSALLELLLAEGAGGPLVVNSEAGGPAGYALARRGRHATYVGPLIATTRTAADQLLDGMLERFAGEDICLDLHRGGLSDPAALVARGLSKRRGLVRMVRGVHSDAGTGRALCASAGPELG
jgi:GNAT superfamily N-acetyltransferase